MRKRENGSYCITTKEFVWEDEKFQRCMAMAVMIEQQYEYT